MLLFKKNEERQEYSGPARVGFSFTYSPQLNCSILFGGCKDLDIYLYNHSKKSWSCKSTTASKRQPKPLKYHAAAVVEQLSALLISGGQDQNGNSLDDFYLLTFKDWKWNKLLLSKSPIARERHSLIPLTKSELLLFGGVSMPYSEFANDVWILATKTDLKTQSKIEVNCFDCSPLPVKGTMPQGGCYAESNVVIGDRLFCGSQKTEKQSNFDFYCLQLKTKMWKKLQLKLKADQLKFYKIISLQREETLILSTSSSSKTYSQPRFYYFSTNSFSLTPIQLGSTVQNIDNLTNDPNSLCQTACAVKGKKIFTIQFWPEQPTINPANNVTGSIQDYLIAIKHEQILSQQLNRKNSLLEDLYKEMQNYITMLNRYYQNYECDLTVENEKAKHIEDCQLLKTQYTRLNQAYEEVVSGIRGLRNQLSAINEDFQRCIETQFDQQA